MWALQNRTPYAAERTWIRDKHGSHHWIVVVKATFEIAADGNLRLSDKQQVPLLAPEYQGMPGVSSVRYESDLTLMKPVTDVTLLGSAYTPSARPVSQAQVSLRVGSIQKSLVVSGERNYYRGWTGLKMSPPLAFTQRPLGYELAFGGTDNSDSDPRKHVFDKRNPIGRGCAFDNEKLIDSPAPCIEYPGGDLAKSGPAGFGPIASHWSPRLELWGSFNEEWEKTKKPLLPADYDDRVVLCSPHDQIAAQHLVGGEVVELINLSPHGPMRFNLPSIHLAFTTFWGRKYEEHDHRLVSVILEPDASRLMMVWQTDLVVKADSIDYLDRTVIVEKVELA